MAHRPPKRARRRTGTGWAVTLLVLMLVLWATGVVPRWPALCFPLLIADLVLLTLGISLLLAPLYVRFRDIGYLWTIVLQVGFWVTPVVYLDQMIPDRWRWIVVDHRLVIVKRYFGHFRPDGILIVVVNNGNVGNIDVIGDIVENGIRQLVAVYSLKIRVVVAIGI